MEERLKIHALYVFGILTTVIIALTTSKWGDNPKLVEYVNFFATLASLVLAILAIVYAYFSNFAVFQSIGEIKSASGAISTTARDVSDAAAELKDRIEMIPKKIDSINVRFDEIKSLMRVPQTNTPLDATDQKKKPLDLADSIANFFERISVTGFASVYCFYLAYENKKTVDLADAFNEFDRDYAWGIMMALDALEVISVSHSEGGWSVTEMPPQWIGPLTTSFRDTYSEVLGDSESMRTALEEKMKRIRDYFQPAATV